MKKLMVYLMLIFSVLYASGQSDLFFHQTQPETDELLYCMEINDAGDLYISGKSFGTTGNIKSLPPKSNNLSGFGSRHPRASRINLSIFLSINTIQSGLG